jgi:hypothetical protein
VLTLQGLAWRFIECELDFGGLKSQEPALWAQQELDQVGKCRATKRLNSYEPSNSTKTPLLCFVRNSNDCREMAVQNFATVYRRIEKERRTRYRGTVSLRISALQYRDSTHEDVADGKNCHVDALKRMFRQERGCRKEDSCHHVKGLVSQHSLEEAVARAAISSGDLMQGTGPFAELEFPPDVKIECLDGHDILAAADKVLQGSKKRWNVDLYLDGMSLPTLRCCG